MKSAACPPSILGSLLWRERGGSGGGGSFWPAGRGGASCSLVCPTAPRRPRPGPSSSNITDTAAAAPILVQVHSFWSHGRSGSGGKEGLLWSGGTDRTWRGRCRRRQRSGGGGSCLPCFPSVCRSVGSCRLLPRCRRPSGMLAAPRSNGNRSSESDDAGAGLARVGPPCLGGGGDGLCCGGLSFPLSLSPGW